jgi:CRISPR/Cas system-associated protein endoribonuclease Cas2
MPIFGVGDSNEKANQVAIRKIKTFLLENEYQLKQLNRVKINGYNVTSKIIGALKNHWTGE